jgi:hypothetical protein
MWHTCMHIYIHRYRQMGAWTGNTGLCSIITLHGGDANSCNVSAVLPPTNR